MLHFTHLQGNTIPPEIKTAGMGPAGAGKGQPAQNQYTRKDTQMQQQLGRILAADLFAVPDADCPLALVRVHPGGLEVLKGKPSAVTLGGIHAISYECIPFSDSPEIETVYTVQGGWNLQELAALLIPPDMTGWTITAVVSAHRAGFSCEARR